MELLLKPQILKSFIYIYIYVDLRLATLKVVSFYLLHNISKLNQCRKLSFDTVVCKHFASYQEKARTCKADENKGIVKIDNNVGHCTVSPVSHSAVHRYNLPLSMPRASPRELLQFKRNDIFPLSKN
jgi:hypothetical protein